MASSKTTVTGIDKLSGDLTRLSKQIRESVRPAVKQSAEAVRQETRSGVRVDTGALRDGVEVRLVDDDLSAEVGWTDPDLYYATFQEHGTSKIPANPALTAAAEIERRRFLDRVSDRVREALK